MSAAKNIAENDMCCASCGTAAIDEIKLEPCNDCDHVHYCSDECRKNHKQTHEAACKERAAELREELLFKQNECNYYGDCPICFLPMPPTKYDPMKCCGKRICLGCSLSMDACHCKDKRKFTTCPFCREPLPRTQEEAKEVMMKKATTITVASGDPLVLGMIGSLYESEGDHDKAFEYWSAAAALGEAVAQYCLARSYKRGIGVEQDEEKEIYFLEEAAIAGLPEARYQLGAHEWGKGQMDRAVKHWMIAATLGFDLALQMLKAGYKENCVSKGDFATALRAHQAATDAMKSPQREEAEDFLEFQETMLRRRAGESASN